MYDPHPLDAIYKDKVDLPGARWDFLSQEQLFINFP